MSILLVPEGVDGDRIDAAAARMTGASRSRVVDLIAESKVLLDGVAVTKASTRVRSGQMLDIDLSDPAPRATVVPAFVADMRIVHDDADVVVVDKPAGVAAHPSLGWDGPSVVEHLAAAGFGISTSGAPERQGIVQRLDVGTSGLMVVAKSEHAYTVLKQAFRDRTPEKIYLALVQGLPDPVVGTIDAPI
ncbi:pseudouridine synthase, partial [Cutibacterium granulosum]